jgi:hypothetical protein
MPANPHKLRLEEQRRGILRQKTAITKYIVEQAPFRMDATDLAVARRNAAMQLSFLQKEYERICFQLGVSSDIRAVKLR